MSQIVETAGYQDRDRTFNGVPIGPRANKWGLMRNYGARSDDLWEDFERGGDGSNDADITGYPFTVVAAGNWIRDTDDVTIWWYGDSAADELFFLKYDFSSANLVLITKDSGTERLVSAVLNTDGVDAIVGCRMLSSAGRAIWIDGTFDSSNAGSGVDFHDDYNRISIGHRGDATPDDQCAGGTNWIGFWDRDLMGGVISDGTAEDYGRIVNNPMQLFVGQPIPTMMEAVVVGGATPKGPLGLPLHGSLAGPI